MTAEVARLERANLQAETLGFSLAESRSILAELQQVFVGQQVAEFVGQQKQCSRCGSQQICKGQHQIVYRTPFGKMTLPSPRFYSCQCHGAGPKSRSPLADLLRERTSPELMYLETKFAALLSYGLTLDLLKEVLPISQDLSTTAIRNQVQRAGERLETEMGEEREVFIEGHQSDKKDIAEPLPPMIVGIDGGYVHACNVKSSKGGVVRGNRWQDYRIGGKGF